MSAESPRRSRAGGPLSVPPQPPCDRSIMDTVSGFINDVALTSGPSVDPKDVVQWARFESTDLDEPRSDSEGDGDVGPLLLVVGYGSGIQAWSIRPGGEAQEVLSWRHGSVRVLRLLPTPSYGDLYAQKRPLIALCDSTGPGAPYCSLSFVSLSGGDQVKSIKFNNPILDVVANKRSIVVSFVERLAVFDACKLEDRLTVTTCYPSPCPLGGVTPTNPLSLGDRWLAYVERRLIPTKRSSGGCEGEGVASYTATVLHAAKSLGKGLRGLGESVASSLGGSRSGVLSQSPSPPHAEQLQPGVVTIIDLENWKIDDESNTNEDITSTINDLVVAHFVAHSEPIVSLKFDASGMILITADKRGHDFHVFRVHPHPSGPNLASVHHLYILHRGDTTAKVQDISISFDTRWVAVSTLRGTTHVFPITPYGGAVGVRTHASPHVVNRLSRFHRSAGLAADGRSNSPVGENLVSATWYPNPRLPPFPAPCTIHPLAQLRPAPAGSAGPAIPTHTITRNSSGRQRLSSLSEEGQLPLVVCARWGAAGRVAAGVTRTRGLPSPPATQALYVMSAHGNLVQYYIHPKHSSGVPKEKVCDDTSIELEVEAKAQWPLLRPSTTQDIVAPLPSHHILIKPMHSSKNSCDKGFLDSDDRWLSQVEIMTHAGPHRRLWMGPQFVFKTYNAASGTSLSLLDSDAVEVGTGPTVARSNPVNMPGARPIVPVLIESGSASSLEHSPRLSDAYRKGSGRDGIGLRDGDNDCHREGEVRLKEDLAEAMRDTDQGCEWTMGGWTKEEDCRAPHVHRIVNPLGTVVSGASSSSPSPPSEGDSYILSNEDEALFRPVVRAPRSLPAPTAPPTRPLSTRTLLPAQHVSVPAETSSVTPAPAASLTDNVVIPAKLSYQQLNLSKSLVKTEKVSNVENVDLPSKIFSKQSNDSKKSPEKILKGIISDKKKSVTKKSNIQSQKHQENLKALKIDQPISVIDKDSEIVISSNPFVEVSKASDHIQFCNNELVENLECEKNIHITAQHCENTLENCTSEYNIDIANICKYDEDFEEPKVETSFKMEETLPKIEYISKDHICEALELFHSPQSESISTIIKKSSKQGKNDTIKKSKETIVPLIISSEKDESWEVLSETKQDASPSIECETSNNDYQILSVADASESIKSNISEDLKPRTKKNKKAKSKPRTVTKCNSPIKTVFTQSDIIQEKITETKPLPVSSFSWSEKVSGVNSKNDLVDLSLDDNIFTTKVSNIYNQSNIVVALCDSPQTTELCFVDEHHSFFQEPPPLEPLDLILDDTDDADDFINYENSSLASVKNDTVEVEKQSMHSLSTSGKKLIERTNDILGTNDEFINIEDFNKQLNKLKKGADLQINFVENMEKLPISMDKSSDEENISPSSSQAESDDGTHLISLQEKYDTVIDTQSKDSPLVSLNPTTNNKANKKKSKRKRR